MVDGLFAGRYELAELLGSGGMARVHRARDTRMGRTVAIKTLLPELARDPDARRRFAREAHAAGSLNHPGIVTVHDQDEFQDGDAVVPYLVMEYVRGGTLSQLVREQAPFEPERAVRIACDILAALAHAHAHGTVHRDVKPANVMITDEGAVKVTDFGIARVLDTDTRLTTAGSSIGTPSYMSPEQINGGDVDARSDLYSVACVLTELLTGKPPFHEGNPLSLMYAHVHADPPRPSTRNPRVPAELDTLVLAAMAKDPAGRPADAGVYRTALWAWLTAARSDTLTGPAATPPQRSGAPRPPADPRATYGVGSALPVLPAAPQESGAATPPPPPAPDPLAKQPADETAGAPGIPGPGRPAGDPAAPPRAEHPAYSLRPQVPLPPPYLPSTPPPVNLSSVVPGEQRRRRRTRNKVLAAVAALAVAGITVSVVLANDGGNSPHPGPTPTHTVLTGEEAALRLHGGKLGTGYNGGVDGVVRPSSQRGGTLHLAASADYLPSGTSLLDPADTYNQPAWNLQRLILRKLVDYAPAPGRKGNQLVPDLATDTGEPGSGGKTWTFHLKSGLRFQDGTPITSQDIKYGVERTFDTVVHPYGPQYFPGLLDDGQHYPGPYKDSDPHQMGLRSVSTPDDRTIVFKLSKPDADFPYVLALSIGAPVPPSADTGGGKDFESKPVASGPYMVKDYTSGTSLELVRNPEWSQATDTVHSQLPEAIDLEIYKNQDEVDQALISGDADLDLEANPFSDATQTRVLGQASLKDNTDLAYTGATRYLSLQTSQAPLNNTDCRQAVEYAVDRAGVQKALGGTYAGGEVATTMLPPTNDSYDPDAAPFTASDGRPQTVEAVSSLAACGHAGGFPVTLAVTDSTRYDSTVQAISGSLKTVGIDVEVKRVPADTFYKTLFSPASLKKAKWGMVLTSWAADWPTGSGFLDSLIEPGGAGNYAGLNDAGLNGMVESAFSATDRATSTEAWKRIDAQVMQDAVMVPLVYDRHLIYRGARLTNVYQQQVLGGVDLTALGVKQ